MRQTKSNWGWWFLVFLWIPLGTLPAQQITLMQLLSLEKNGSYTISRPNVALMHFNPKDEWYLTGLKPYSVHTLSQLSVGGRMSAFFRSSASVDLHYFGYDTWRYWHCRIAVARTLTPVLQGGITLSYLQSGITGERFIPRANVSVHLALRVKAHLYITSSLENLWPSSSKAGISPSSQLIIRAYYWLNDRLGGMAGMSLNRRGRYEAVAGLGLQKKGSGLSFVVYPISGRFGFGLQQKTIRHLYLQLSAERHPLLGNTLSGGIIWRKERGREK